MRSSCSRVLALLTALSCASSGIAGPLVQRDSSTTTSTSTGTSTGTSTSGSSTSSPTVALAETTINGKATTLEVSVPTGDASVVNSKTPTATGSDAVTSTLSLANSPTADTNFGPPSLLECKKPTGNPICRPSNESAVYVGDIYYVTWDPSRFDSNATINILLNYANDTANGNRAAWNSGGIPKQKGFVTVEMQDAWRQNTLNSTLQLTLTSYAIVSDQSALPVQGPTLFLSKKPAQHYPPPPHTKLPDHLSLFIGVPLGVGALLFVLIGLYFGMRKHRHISVGSVMGRRRGYGTGKSRRQRLGIKKGAIRLEEREIQAARQHDYEEDEIRPAPRAAVGDPTWPLPPSRDGHGFHGREESLGSLASDGPDGNAFRREMEKQRTGR